MLNLKLRLVASGKIRNIAEYASVFFLAATPSLPKTEFCYLTFIASIVRSS